MLTKILMTLIATLPPTVGEHCYNLELQPTIPVYYFGLDNAISTLTIDFETIYRYNGPKDDT